MTFTRQEDFFAKEDSKFFKYNITFQSLSDSTCFFTFKSVMYKGGNRKFVLFCKSTIVPTSLHCCFKFFDSDLSIPFVMIYMCFPWTFVDTFEPNKNLELSFGLSRFAFNKMFHWLISGFQNVVFQHLHECFTLKFFLKFFLAMSILALVSHHTKI
jgi:hypothetical protein